LYDHLGIAKCFGTFCAKALKNLLKICYYEFREVILLKFADKMDLLMNVTKTSNSLLARQTALDASFISRLHRGQRTPPRDVNYIKTMSIYFARSCKADYQKAAVLGAIADSSLHIPNPSSPLADIIERWLREEARDGEQRVIGEFLDGLAHFHPDSSAKMPLSGAEVVSPSVAPIETYYGIEGKRAGVLTFLSLVLQNPSPQTLLLHSDEDMDWMTGSPEFTSQWAALMLQILSRGNRIRIIHNVNRDLDEMMAGIRGWVPIYMSGAVEPYYYPRTRDGLFRRTLFIAPESGVLTSSSVRGGSPHALTLLLTAPETVRALAGEYHDFLALCRPLMRIFTHHNQADYLLTLSEFEGESGDTIIKSDRPTSLTLPPDVVASLAARDDSAPVGQLLSYQQTRIAAFEQRLLDHHFTEIFPLPSLEDILAGQIAVNFCDIPDQTRIFYTPGEFHRHLHNIIRLLKTCGNYHVYLAEALKLRGSLVYVKDNVGVLVGNIETPPVVFAINEANMTTAFWDYLQAILPDQRNEAAWRAQTITELEALAARLPATDIFTNFDSGSESPT